MIGNFGGKSRRRFFLDLAMLGGGLVVAGVLMSRKSAQATPTSGSLAFEAFSHIKTMDDYYADSAIFAGLAVVDYDANKPARSDVAYRFRTDWNDIDLLVPALKHFIETPEAGQATALVIGAWHGEDPEKTPESIIKLLVANKDKLSNLKAIWIGDISGEENEMSWINQCDLSPLLQAFPKLELLRSKGGAGLELKQASHPALRALVVETGGLDASYIKSLSASNFPNLEYLELWLGTDEYGCTVKVADLQAILSGKLFPKLKYLGLRNYYQADELATAVVDSALVSRVETLDLSLGILTDPGGEALLGLKSSGLKKLNLYHNYFGTGAMSKLKSLPFNVELSNPDHMEDDPEYRFVAVGE